MQESILKLLKDRYFLGNENTWEDLATRVSGINEDAKSYISSMSFIPSSPTLMNACTNGERLGTLSSCFPMHLEDSIEGIYESLKEAAVVTKYGGGVGYDFSTLRGSIEEVATLKRNSSGPVPFMKNFDAMLDGIQQGGVRRGAGMGLCDIEHPNVLDVIRCKDNDDQMTRLNISIKIGDSFYKQLETNPDAVHQVKTKDGVYVDLIDNGKKVTVKQLWNEIVYHAWKRAEPGIFNKDIATNRCSVTNLNPLVLCNPCSEFTNIPYTSCNLGSINLTHCVVDGKFSWSKFKEIIVAATNFLDAVIDVNKYPLDKIEQTTKAIRPIGLGVMGFAHMLFMLGVPYNSKEAFTLADELFLFLTTEGMKQSIKLAEEKGAYPAFDLDTFLKANKRFLDKVPSLVPLITKYGIRNSCNTSIAPTGSISFIANTTGGIEPLFALSYARKIEKLNREYETVFIVDELFDKYLKENFDEKVRVKILTEVSENKGSCQEVKEIPDEIKKVFVTAGDLTPMEHLEMLGAIAKNISTSVSKTINLPATATVDQVAEVYLEAHKKGIIGVTVYRDGCREGILVHKVVDNKEQIVKTNAPKRPKSLPCHVYRMNIYDRLAEESQAWIVFVGLLDGEPYEIIAGKIDGHDIPAGITEGEMVKVRKAGKKVYQFVHNGEVLCEDVVGTYLNDIREYVTRLMSWGLRHGAGIEFLREVLQKSNGTIVDFNKAIIRAINKYVKEVNSKEKCPTCNYDLIYVEGCIKCSNPECSYSKCG